MHKWMIYCGLAVALTCQPALCSIFSGPNNGLSTNLYQWAFSHNWDLSNLSVVDTADGMKITGSMSATIDNAEPADVSGVFLQTYRPLNDTTNLDLIQVAQLSGTLSYTGGIIVTQVSTITSLTGGSGCFSTASTSVYSETGLPSSIASGPVEVACQYTTVNPPGYLSLNAAVYYTHNGPGTITLDFGNSILAEARLADTGVPEPSTLWLLSAIVPLVLIRRRK